MTAKARDIRATTESSTPEYDPRMEEASRLADVYDRAEATLDYTPQLGRDAGRAQRAATEGAGMKHVPAFPTCPACGYELRPTDKKCWWCWNPVKP